MRTYVIPDIHGMKDLLDKALYEIDIRESPCPGQHKVIFLGDYIDRGPQSAQVIKTIKDGIEQGKPWVALKGNHEDMMISAIEMPANSYHWSMNGGDKALDSYNALGTNPVHDLPFLKSLKLYYKDKHRLYVHAHAPEHCDIEDAPENEIIWTRYAKGQDIGYKDLHVVHGHTPHKSPELYNNRTNLDCGAVFGNCLAVAIFLDDLPGGPTSILGVK